MNLQSTLPRLQRSIGGNIGSSPQEISKYLGQLMNLYGHWGVCMLIANEIIVHEYKSIIKMEN